MAKVIIEREFGMIPNDLLYNTEMSLASKGLYGFIYAKPDDWDFSVERISAELKEGEKAVNNAIKELEKFGWLSRNKFKNSKGRWEVEYTLHARAQNTENHIPSTTPPQGRVENEENEKNHTPSTRGGQGRNNKKYNKKYNNISSLRSDILFPQNEFADETLENESDFCGTRETEISVLENPETKTPETTQTPKTEVLENTEVQKSSARRDRAVPVRENLKNMEISGVPVTSTREIAEKRAKVLAFLRQAVGVDKFSDVSEWAEAWRMERLAEKLGKQEFLARMQGVLADPWKQQRCNRLSFLRKEIESFIHSPVVATKPFNTKTRVW